MRFTASPAAARARSPASKRSTSTAKIHCRASPHPAVFQRIALRLLESSHATVKITASPSNPVNRPKLFSLPHEFEPVRKDLFEAVVFPTRLAAKNDPGGGEHKLAQHLQTSTAGRTCRLVQIGDSAGKHAHLRPVLSDRPNHRRSLRTNGKAVRGVLYVGASNQGSVLQQQGGSHTKFRVRRIGVVGGIRCLGGQLPQHFRGESVFACLHRSLSVMAVGRGCNSIPVIPLSPPPCSWGGKALSGTMQPKCPGGYP